jgi:DNA polymerase elongation subunit (family B)
MNTYYGEAGNKKSPIYMLEVAGGITAAGRSNIKLAYDFVQSKNCKVYYGDSVTGDTPILIRYTKGDLTGIINIVAIEDID